MAGQRIKGQEVNVLVTRDAELETELTDIRSLEAAFQLEVKTDAFLGELTNRKDMIYNGIKGTISMHLHSQLYQQFVDGIIAIAQRKTPDSFINISGIFNFPNGDVLSLIFPEVVFGEIPLKVSARGDFVEATFAFEGSGYIPQYS